MKYFSNLIMKIILFKILLLGILLKTVSANAQNIRPLKDRESPWVTINNYNYSESQLDVEAEDGYIDLVYDKQVSLKEQATYHKRALKVLTETGIQNSSQISVNFDPSYEKLIFHSIYIIRGNQRINQLNLSKIKVIQQETELDRFIYNDSRSAVLILEDVRKGDIIEYSYTLKGFNPVFKNKYADVLSFNYSVPLYHIYYKIISPTNKKLNIKENKIDIQPAIQSSSLGTSYEWRKDNVRALRLQSDVPSWYDPYSSVSISEYNNWKEVNDWAMDLFAPVSHLAAPLQKKVDEIKKFNTIEEQILSALKFVQDDIRYMGIEMGENSHRPNEPDKVFSQRFGDCKDKSYLLCTILGALGIEANPVLINTTYKKTIADWLPSHFAFDHVTVRVKFNNRFYYFDPTISYQRGEINDISFPDYQCGLVIEKNTLSLTKIELQDHGRVSINEIFTIPDYKQDSGKLLVNTEYYGSFADNVRRDFNSSSLYEMQKSYRDYYANYYSKIVADSIAYHDNEKSGLFTTVEYYTIPDIWKLEKGIKKVDFDPYVINGVMRKPNEADRTMPFEVIYPAKYEENIVINLPEEWDAEEFEDKIKCSVFSLNTKFSYTSKKIKLHYEYETLKDHVLPSETASFIENIQKKENSMSSYYISWTDSINSENSQKKNKPADGNDLLDSNLFKSIIVMLLIGFIIWAVRNRHRSSNRY